MIKKEIKLQHRKYFGTDKKTQYTRHRINIPDDIIKRLGWNQENKIALRVDQINNRRVLILEINQTKK